MKNIKAFTMPKWGIEMQEGTISEWVVKEGQSFKKGEIIALIETDKISNEVEAEFDGVLRKIVTPSGQTEPVGTLLGVFGDTDVPDDEIETFAQSFEAADTGTAVGRNSDTAAPAPAETASPQSPEPAPPAISDTSFDNLNISPKARELAIELQVDATQISGSGRNGRITYQDVHQASRPEAKVDLGGALPMPVDDESIFASPLAKRLAAMNGIDLKGVAGTGARGRIRKEDVFALLPDASARPQASLAQNTDNTPQIVEMDKIRKVIAKRLTEAKSTIPHFYIRSDFDVENLLEFRRIGNKVLNTKASLNDYMIKAVGRALAEHRDVNVQVHDDKIHYYPHANVGVAIAAKSGLITPVVKNVDLMDISDISRATTQLIKKANSGKLGLTDLEGGTLTISNLGMMGVDQFDAIINPPQGSILAIGGISRVMTELEDGSGEFRSKLSVAMSCDHRAIDGAAGAKFMATLKSMIEEPELFF